MPIYQYKALDRRSAKVHGTLEASNEKAAYQRLTARKLEVFSLSERPKQFKLNLSYRIPERELTRYIAQLATLIRAGVSLLEALDSLSKSRVHPALAKATGNIRSDLRAGDKLSAAMAKHLPSLPPYVPRLVELGEVTGQPAKALTDAAERMEFDHNTRNEVRTALSYPMFLATIGTAIVFLMFIFIVPRFESLIGDKHDDLPLISKLVINTGMALTSNLPLVLIALALLIAGAVYSFSRADLRQRLRGAFERLWVLGPVLIQSDLGGWARTVGIALDNGADLLSALRLGMGSMRSRRLLSGLQSSYNEVRAGRNLDEVLLESIPDFDPLTIDLIRTGRTSGKLAEMLLFIGRTQERETRERVKRATSLAEPISIVLISLVIGTIVIGIVLAMTSLYNFDIG